jgi:hypothetical protein
VAEGSSHLLGALAQQVVGQAKVNIQANDQIDTGFLINSGYAVSEEGSTYSDTYSDGEYTGQKSGQTSEHAKEPEVLPAEGEAIAAFGANYAIHQEVRNSFLYRALEQVGESEAVGRIVSEMREKL